MRQKTKVQGGLTVAPRALLAGLACLLWGPGATAPAQTARYEPRWESVDRRPNPAWYGDAKFGIFIHWGVYSVPAFAPVGDYAEWYWNSLEKGRRLEKEPEKEPKKEPKKEKDRATLEFHRRVYGDDFKYQDFAPLFRAEMFDPDRWAEVFLRSGAKYVVLTSKHHDGFCLWPSEQASQSWGRPWNSVDAGPRRDLLGDLSEAVRRKGLRMGYYYSLYEWYHPLWLADKPRYIAEHMTPQFRDLVTRYRPSLIFSDGEWDLPSAEWKSPELLAWLYNESPVKDEVVVNDRWGKDSRHKHGGYFTTEYGSGLKDATNPWEENRGMGYSYGYNRAEALKDYRTARELVLMLVDTVSRGGNLLLDIGPTADGRIPVLMEERLTQIGDWLRVNGEAIYGTRGWRVSRQWSAGRQPEVKYGEFMTGYDINKLTGRPAGDQAAIEAFFTAKGNSLYAILPRWPGKEFTLKEIVPAQGATVTLLGAEAPLTWKAARGGLVVQFPEPTDAQLAAPYGFVLRLTGVK